MSSSTPLPLALFPEEDFLRPAPSPVPRWVVPATLIGLGVLLLGLYLFGSDLSQAAVLLGTLPLTTALLGYLIFRQHRFGRAIADARQLLAARQVKEALKAFEALCREHRRPVSHHAEAVTLFGVTSLLLGDHQRALGAFSVVESCPGVRGWSTVFEPLAGWLALGFFVAGDRDAAQVWVDEARRRGDAVSRVISLLPEACLSLHRGDSIAAVELLTREWSEEQVALAAPVLQELRLVRAFALSQQPSSPQQAEEMELLLRGLGRRPQDHAWLTNGWPSLRVFAKKNLASA